MKIAEVEDIDSGKIAELIAHLGLAAVKRQLPEIKAAAKLIFDLPERPKEKAFREMARDWAPWRSVAARIMWAYYKQNKQREGIT